MPWSPWVKKKDCWLLFLFGGMLTRLLEVDGTSCFCWRVVITLRPKLSWQTVDDVPLPCDLFALIAFCLSDGLVWFYLARSGFWMGGLGLGGSCNNVRSRSRPCTNPTFYCTKKGMIVTNKKYLFFEAYPLLAPKCRVSAGRPGLVFSCF